MNKVCKEHEWVEFPSVCCKCGSQKPIRDFKIKENLEVINKQEWEDIWENFRESTYFKTTSGIHSNLQYVAFLNWLKENYIAPEKENS